MLPTIEIFNITIPTFQLMIAIGTVLACLTFFFNCKREKITVEEFSSFAIMIAVVIIGGLFFAVLADKIAHFSEGEWFELAGISFSGGLIGGFLSFSAFYFVLVKGENRNYYKHISLFVTPVIIVHAFGRIGCFCSGCCYGIESDCFLAVTFPSGSLQELQMGYITAVLPVQLFEAFFLFVLYFLLMFVFKKHHVVIYLFSYGIFRFFIEFLRGDNRGSYLLGLSPSQFLSIIFVILGVFFLIFERKNGKLTVKKD